MPIPFLAMSLAAKFLPSLISKLTGSDKAGEVAEDVVNIARRITGKEDPSEVTKALEGNPQLALEFQQELHNYELELEREYTKQLETVNATMREEARAGGIQAFWRPFNGILFGVTIWCDYFLAQIIMPYVNSKIVWEHVPMPVYVLWAGVLGVTAASRGKEKITKMKAEVVAGRIPALSGLNVVKEFGKGILGM